jgi:hypothetical protein
MDKSLTKVFKNIVFPVPTVSHKRS